MSSLPVLTGSRSSLSALHALRSTLHAFRPAVLAAAVVALSAPARAANEPRELFGYFKGKIVLKATDKPHRLKGLMTVGPESLLVIQAGAVVYFAPSGDGSGGTLKVLGGLVVNGTATKPVVFLADVPGQIVVGDIARKDNRRRSKRPVGAIVKGAYFYRVGVQVSGGASRFTNFHLHEGHLASLGRNPAMMIVSAGTINFKRCTFTGDATVDGLRIERWDTYPSVVVDQCRFTETNVGLAVVTKTLRRKRAPITITSCNFDNNAMDLTYLDDSYPLAVRNSHFSGAKNSREAAEHVRSGRGRGRIIFSSIARRPHPNAGAGLKTEVDITAILATVAGRPAADQGGVAGPSASTPAGSGAPSASARLPAGPPAGMAAGKGGDGEQDEEEEQPEGRRRRRH